MHGRIKFARIILQISLPLFVYRNKRKLYPLGLAIANGGTLNPLFRVNKKNNWREL